MNSATNPSRQKANFFKAFHAHPASVGETYFGHMRFALRFSGKLFLAGGAALLHAFIPPLCETTASQAVKELHEMCNHRGAKS
ncbi:MAG: DUF6356 family protein [Pseudomonadota bacterium]